MPHFRLEAAGRGKPPEKSGKSPKVTKQLSSKKANSSVALNRRLRAQLTDQSDVRFSPYGGSLSPETSSQRRLRKEKKSRTQQYLEALNATLQNAIQSDLESKTPLLADSLQDVVSTFRPLSPYRAPPSARPGSSRASSARDLVTSRTTPSASSPPTSRPSGRLLPPTPHRSIPEAHPSLRVALPELQVEPARTSYSPQSLPVSPLLQRISSEAHNAAKLRAHAHWHRAEATNPETFETVASPVHVSEYNAKRSKPQPVPEPATGSTEVPRKLESSAPEDEFASAAEEQQAREGDRPSLPPLAMDAVHGSGKPQLERFKVEGMASEHPEEGGSPPLRDKE